MVARLGKGLRSAAFSVFGLIAFALLFGGPFIVYYGFPIQAYRVTLIFGVLAILVSVLFGLLAIAKPMRPTSGSVICICSYVVAAFLWVWSVLIVGQTWGMGTLFFVNLFIGVGTVVTAFAASLLTAQWGVLGQLVAIALISLGLRVAGVALASK